MQKTKLINRVIAGAMLSFALATQSGQVVQAEAQRPTFLLRAKCVDSGLGNVRQKTLDVSIGKAVYTSRFYLGSGNRAASITCKIRQVDSQPLFQTLQLGFGMRDNATSPPVVVNVYLDGQQAESRTIAPTQQESLSLDVSKATNVTLEAVCSSQSIYCERVYFFNAALEPLILAPSPSK